MCIISYFTSSRLICKFSLYLYALYLLSTNLRPIVSMLIIWFAGPFVWRYSGMFPVRVITNIWYTYIDLIKANIWYQTKMYMFSKFCWDLIICSQNRSCRALWDVLITIRMWSQINLYRSSELQIILITKNLSLLIYICMHVESTMYTFVVSF